MGRGEQRLLILTMNGSATMKNLLVVRRFI